MLKSVASGSLGIRSLFWNIPCSFILLSTVVTATRLSTSQAFVSPLTTASSHQYQRTPFRRPFHHTTAIMSAAAAAPPPPVVKHVPSDELPEWMLPERTRVLTTTHSSSKNAKGKCIVYWMQRDVRTVDNWALLYAAHLAKEQKVPLRVLYCLMPPSDSDDTMAPFYEQPLTERYGHFLLGGLQLVHTELAEQKVPLHVVQPPSLDAVGDTVMDHVSSWQPSCIICDHSHLKPYRTWLDDQLVPLCNENASSMSVVHVDAHNVVPVWHAAPVRQIGARTLRPKIHKLLDQFLKSNDFPALQGANDHVSASVKLPDFEKDQYLEFLNLDGSVKSVDWAQPGTKAATMQFNSFTKTGLKQFHELRNDPNMGKIICSNLSPWINHGHVSFQRLAAIMQADFHKKYANGTAMYVEEGLIRRELSDNFVYYTPGTYDSLESALVWAQETLQVHAVDEREWSFTPAELEEAKSHDDLWNAAQLQLVQEGKLHGFLRMYWAKKILEWSESPEVALQTAQYLNDKYALDGCDPNGYVGVGWSIMGIHDQGWKEREVFGKNRYMNYAGCKRKFDVQQFVKNYPPAAKNAADAAKKHGGESETGKKKPTAAALAKKEAAAAAKKPATKKKTGTKRKNSS